MQFNFVVSRVKDYVLGFTSDCGHFVGFKLYSNFVKKFHVNPANNR